MLVGAVRGVEAGSLPTRDFRYHLLPSRADLPRQWWKNFRWPLLAGRLLRERGASCFEAERPVAVLGTGGYASAPGGLARGAAGIPTAIQEQNAYPGPRHPLAQPAGAARLSRVCPRRGDCSASGRDPGLRHRQPDRAARRPSGGRTALKRFGLEPTLACVLITGGSQGSLAINGRWPGGSRRAGRANAGLIWVTGRGTYDGVRAAFTAHRSVQVDRLPRSDGGRLRGGGSGRSRGPA